MSVEPADGMSAGSADGGRVVLRGAWTVQWLAAAAAGLESLDCRGRTRFDVSGVTVMDSAGAWAVERARRALRTKGCEVEFSGASEEQELLLAHVAAFTPELPLPAGPRLYFLEMLNRMGAGLIRVTSHTLRQIGFTGMALACAARTLFRPARLRLTSAVHHMEAVGIDAVPIVALLSFLIGTVMVFVAVQQLARFGAELYTINMLEVAVYREMAPLLTAIIVAGRSGSAFTAQIGAMVVNEEVDAMRSMGLDPLEMLVLPRLLALVLMVPLLTFIADMLGVLGGGLMCWSSIGIAPAAFLERFQSLPWPWHFRVGLIKAPFFAVIIGAIGCFEGFEVQGSSASVGERTTRSVVEAIFWVIVLDAAFAAFFSILGY
ncbi:protein of unknown function DUF140 [Desulfovibrio sp. X2]|uniref:ABC transporter permease n=1 Tax=Desulfovibrio sp. X2 TaxID=941449 RepID=UPI000358B992|nr:MlaE family lipid ABC transporter permease subunit [Desulfovibrio sp. X2]EPR44694.1 protein of unknown function DUF140 [Desulfovibrio sp. X2]